MSVGGKKPLVAQGSKQFWNTYQPFVSSDLTIEHIVYLCTVCKTSQHAWFSSCLSPELNANTHVHTFTTQETFKNDLNYLHNNKTITLFLHISYLHARYLSHPYKVWLHLQPDSSCWQHCTSPWKTISVLLSDHHSWTVTSFACTFNTLIQEKSEYWYFNITLEVDFSDMTSLHMWTDSRWNDTNQGLSSIHPAPPQFLCSLERLVHHPVVCKPVTSEKLVRHHKFFFDALHKVPPPPKPPFPIITGTSHFSQSLARQATLT